jgi:hypothetical protein
MARHRHRLSAPVLIGVGAAFDFHAGLLRRAPRWLQRTGLEWAFRLAIEPRRLAKRYLLNNPAFLALLAGEKLGVSQIVRRKGTNSILLTKPAVYSIRRISGQGARGAGHGSRPI